MKGVAEVVQGGCWDRDWPEPGAHGAVAELVQDMCEDFLLHRQGPGPSPHELQLLQTPERDGVSAQG